MVEKHQLADSLQWWETLVLVFNIAGALGVVLFVWYLLKLAGVITSIAGLPKKEGTGVVEKSFFTLFVLDICHDICGL